MGKTFISQNIHKTSERIDIDGNVIDPRTKQVIMPKEEETPQTIPQPPQTAPIQPPEATTAPPASPVAKDAMAIQDEIEQAKANLARLEEAKKVKIAEMEEQLKKLKQ
jgi:hypothetical protein